MVFEVNRLRWVVAGLAVLVLCGAAFGTRDLQISQALFDPRATWAMALETYGEVPGLALVAWAVVRLAGQLWQRRQYIYGLLLAPWAGWVLDSMVRHVAADVSSSVVVSVWSGGARLAAWTVAGFGMSLFYARGVPISVQGPHQAVMRVAVWMAGVHALLVVQLTKVVWGRVRFRDLAADYSNFTPWYMPQGFTGHRSFMSGHAALAWVLLALTEAAQTPAQRRVSWALVLGYGTLMCVSRIVVGAHYATDVFFSTAIAWLVFLLVRRRSPVGVGVGVAD
jgi:membrane-associated phospholipid phosphatase